MKLTSTLTILFLSFNFLMGQSTEVDLTIIGNESSEYSTDLDTLSDFIYLVGNTNECGSNDGFVVKYKNDSLYKRSIIGSESIEILESIETKSSDTLFVGGFTNENNDYDVYLAKLDTQLNVIDSKTIELPNWNFCRDIATSSLGLIGVGETHNNSDYDVLFFKVNNNLDTLWTRNITSDKDQKLTKVIAYNDSIYIACGYTEVDGLSKDILLISFNINTGDTLWTNHYGDVNDEFCNSIIKTNDGGIAGFGTTSSYTSTTEDTFLFKTDSAGNFLWSNLHQVQTALNVYNDRGVDLVQLQNGDFIIAALSASFGSPGIISTFIIKTNSSGVYLDGYIYDGGKDDYPTALVKTSDSSFYISGTANSQTLGYTDAYLLNINKVEVSNTLNTLYKQIDLFCFTEIQQNERSKNSFSVYPNPFSSNFEITLENNVKNNVKIYDLIGNMVYFTSIEKNKTIDFPTELSNGTYIIALENGEKIEFVKIVYAQ